MFDKETRCRKPGARIGHAFKNESEGFVYSKYKYREF